MARADLGAIIAQTMTPPETVRTIEVITDEIRDAQRKGGDAILTIGRCLMEAKEQLPHGEWLPWLSEQVGYSEKTAQNFMRLAREFSNPQALADLGATKALALLALPAEEREQFVAEHNVVDMTSRQLQQAIRERDEARAAAEQAKADRASAEAARAKMEEDMRLANASMVSAQEERDRADENVRRLEAELEEIRSRPVDVALVWSDDRAAIDKARAEVRAEMREKLKIARSQRREAEEALVAAQKKLAELQVVSCSPARGPMRLNEADVINLTNDAKRKAILDAWREWPVWAEIPEIGLTVHKLDLPGGGAFTACWYSGDDFFPGGGAVNANRPRYHLIGHGGMLAHGCQAESVLKDALQELRKDLMEESHADYH